MSDRRETAISDSDRETLLVIIKERRQQYRKGEVLLGAVYFTSIVISVVSSALAALIPQLNLISDNSELQKDVASGLAFLATILIAITTSVALSKQWEASRRARVQIDNLKLDLIKSTVNKDDFIEKLKNIEETRNPRIVDTPSP